MLIARSRPDRSPARSAWKWRVFLVVWLAFLCLGPDPRPLGAPGWAIDAAQLLGLGARAARAVATLMLRASGLALLGALVIFAIGPGRRRWVVIAAVLVAPALAVTTLWVNYGYLPINTQIQIATVSAALGSLAALALQRNIRAAAGLVVVTAGLFVWGAATGIDDDLDAVAGLVGRHVMSTADRIPDGDAGFARLLEVAFAFAEDNSHGSDAVAPNKAAILALGVILGDERVADVARRRIDEQALPEADALRARITVHGRPDWSRHFWVSAALTVLADANRSITVGLTKELMDAAPDGSGFSFSDLAADAAGGAFAVAATRDSASARAMQRRIAQGVRIEDFLPDVRDLPEGLTRDQLQSEYGGVGGEGTRRIVDDILQRLRDSPGLQ